MRLRLSASFAVFVVGWIWLDASAQSGGPIVSGAHRFEKVAEGIYYATASGTMTVGANSPIILTDTEALVVDSEITPAAARALVADLKAVTDKPVKYVVDSHYHYDHAFGNQVFAPDAQVIGHENTRKRLLGNTMAEYTYLSSVEPVPARVIVQHLELDRPQRRLWLLVRDTAGQGNVIRETWGWLHYAFYVGFLGLFTGTTIIFFNDEIAEAAGFFGFPYYLVGMMEVL